tara:strand:+ start:14516 stop:14866 length:351 start_codon:yes stop_codon:yes gene_type:complete
MKHLKWFEIEVYFPIDASLFEENEELTEVQKMSAHIVEGYEVGVAYFNMGQVALQSLLPKCFIPKGNKNKKFYTELIFSDGSFAFATAKPAEVYKLIDDYLDKFPEDTEEENKTPE